MKIAAIFSYQANEDMDDGADEHSQELLERCIQDYNAMYGTAFGIDTFDPYRKDIAKRLKQKVLPQVDILIVVNMSQSVQTVLSLCQYGWYDCMPVPVNAIPDFCPDTAYSMVLHRIRLRTY